MSIQAPEMVTRERIATVLHTLKTSNEARIERLAREIRNKYPNGFRLVLTDLIDDLVAGIEILQATSAGGGCWKNVCRIVNTLGVLIAAIVLREWLYRQIWQNKTPHSTS